MTYLLYLAFINATPPQQIGPFATVMACEQAAAQIKVVDNRVRGTACLNVNVKPLHWNGKPLK